jgi:AcrR family transcriptional regulator
MSARSDVDAEVEPRVPLTRGRVLRAAVDLADREGLDALTMRRLAQDLGVEAMSLYHHVAGKDAVLDGVAEVIVGEAQAAVDAAELSAAADDWQAALRARILTARSVMLRHPWAPSVLETRKEMNPTIVAWFDQVLGVLVEGGFSFDLAHHAMHALGSRALGFTQELFVPDDPDVEGEEALAMFEQMAEQFPYITGMMAEVVHDDAASTLGWCDDQAEFEFGLDVLLDGLERRRARG